MAETSRNMSHIVFFSYARKDEDPYLEGFFRDLCLEISTLVEYSADDPRLSFRDKSSLPMMENWSTNIMGALQSSAVMVCVTTAKYFSRKFCGKEYYIFDQRRRQGLAAGQNPPPVILPVIWVPAGGLPDFMNEVQQVPREVADSYRDSGLRYLRRFDTRSYDLCVSAFAQAIVKAWKNYRNIKPLDKVPKFDDVPSSFAAGKWTDAVGPEGGWLPGPEVVNFVFVAQSKEDCPNPEGRYGSNSSEWRPYFPSELETILDHASEAVKKQFRFREIRVDDDLPAELKSAKERRNLSVVVGDPRALVLEDFKSVRSIEELWWEGSALLLPCHEPVDPWEPQAPKLKSALPILSQAKLANYRGPLRTPAELQAALDATLCELRKAVTQPAIDNKQKSADPPPDLSPAGRVGS